jgi:uncharacterized protein YkwD
MPRLLRPVLAGLLALAACGAPSDDAPEPVAAAAVGVERNAGDERRAARPTTTTTTAAPTTTTTAAPPPPPTTVAPAPPPTAAPGPAPAAAAPAPAPAPPPAAAPVADPGAEAQLLDLVNRERAAAGLPALRRSGGAAGLAREWAGVMGREQRMRHHPDLSGGLAAHGVTGWRRISENVGYGASAGQVHTMFMGSAGHRANILDPAVSEVGIGVVSAGGKVWVVLDFVGY